MLSTQNLTIEFHGHLAVNNITHQFTLHQLTAIIGPNGAGKTTLFNGLTGQLRPNAGQITLNQCDITHYPPHKRSQLGLGRVFQLSQLCQNLSVADNLRLSLIKKHHIGWQIWGGAHKSQNINQRIEEICHEFGLLEVMNKPAHTLSHGMARKCELAVVIAGDSPIILMDEPTAGLPPADTPMMIALINKLKTNTKKTFIMVEHKMAMVMGCADEILVLHNGEILAHGDPQAIMHNKQVGAIYLGQNHHAMGVTP